MSCKELNIPGKNPNLECFYLVVQGGSTGMNNVFELPPKFVTWDSKLTSMQRPFWEPQSAKIGFKFSPILTDLCHILFYTVHYTLLIIQCTLNTQCPLSMFTVHCTVYSVQCILYTVQCTLYTALGPHLSGRDFLGKARNVSCSMYCTASSQLFRW